MRMVKLTISIFVLVLLLFPFYAVFIPQEAHAGSLLLIDCTGGPLIAGTNEHECGFIDVIAEIKQLINFTFLLALPITVIAVTWAGIKILLSRGNPGKVSEAKKLATQVLTGFIIVLTAWLIVYTITSQLLKEEFYTPFLGDQNSNNAIK